MKQAASFGAVGLALAILIASLVPSPYGAVREETSGAFLDGARMDPEAAAILRTACADCHSCETKWPWYSHVAPFSWMLERDVAEARKFLNLSRWPEYGPEGQRQLLDLALADMQSRKMPPARYLALHPEASLSPQQLEILAARLPRESERLAADTSKQSGDKTQ